MNHLSRRDFVNQSLALAGLSLLPFPALRAFATKQADDPHFFVQVVLVGGADPVCSFDARPLSMTRAKLIHNFYKQEPKPWIGSNGQTCLATAATDQLRPIAQYFSVLNGVHMSTSFDGHGQNMQFLFCGNPFGGPSFVPHLNTGSNPTPLDFLQTSGLFFSATNMGRGVELGADAFGKMAKKLQALSGEVGSPLMNLIRSRFEANQQGGGLFSSGAARLLAGQKSMPALIDRIRTVKEIDPKLKPLQKDLELIRQGFVNKVAGAAILPLRGHFFDVHFRGTSKKQPKLFTAALGEVKQIIEFFRQTPYDRKTSLLDHTTIVVSSEFGRTMRQKGMDIEETGTDHNPLTNTVLIAGRGIKTGLVVGASDLQNEKDQPSKAHLIRDAKSIKLMGKPFHHATLTVENRKPDLYKDEDYLSYSSIVNTLYKLYGVDAKRYRKFGRRGPIAPVLDKLLA